MQTAPTLHKFLKVALQKAQPLDVSINKPFKLVLGDCWEKYIMNIIETLFPEMISDLTNKFPPPSRQHFVDWVVEGYNYLLLKTRRHQEVI